MIKVNQSTRIPASTCDDGHKIKAGDSIWFSYGIPPVRVVAKVERIGSLLYAMTPDHNPRRCELGRLRKFVGCFYKV